jgi:redox-sensitive bicupin YhaK (pirin superfamily)
MNGMQSWVALPKEYEETEPAFTHYGTDRLPASDEDGVWMRIIAGEAFGMKADVKTHSPMFYVHGVLTPGARWSLPDAYTERGAYVVSGSIEADGHTFGEGQMLVFGRGNATVKAVAPAVVMLLGGEPLGERFIEWNFVSSSKARIEQAKSDWRAGRMKLPDHDNTEFIPLPGDPPPPANPMS